jgi:hypothetical protein
MKPVHFGMILCLIAAMTGLSCSKEQSGPALGAAPATKTTNIYYFHRTIRCPSCEKIEALTKQAVDSGFAGDLAAGTFAWRVVNIDTPENAHFEKDYQLRAQSVVVSESNNGKELRWKNLDKVWDMLEDDAGFIRYVQDEIRSFAQES